MSVIIYGDMKNRAGRIIWALEELGVPYEARGVKLMRGEQRSEEFLALNPKGKVPVCLIPIAPNEEFNGGETRDEICDETHDQVERVAVTESVAILYALAERFNASAHESTPTLLPPRWRGRVRCHEWLAFGETELEPPIWIHAKHSFIYPEKRRVSDIFPSCHYDYQRALKHLESALADGRDWITGDHFCVADVFIGQTLMWGEMRDLGELGPQVMAYLERLKARPAWARTFSRSEA